jgi:hypothetical protein
VPTRIGESRGVWLAVGLLLGLGIAYFWPHEPLRADQADRNDKFGMLSTAASAGGGFAAGEAVFILDYLTGRLQGFFLSPRVGGFTQMFYRDVAKDFGLGGGQATYAFVGGQGQLIGHGGTWGSSMIYVAELNTGALVAYAFPYTEQNRQAAPEEMVVVDKAQFRAPVVK